MKKVGLPDKKINHLKEIDFYINNIKKYKYFISLIFLNFITHYLFISRYSFVSDDWNELVFCIFNQYSWSQLLLESQRSLYYIILKIAAGLFGSSAIAYQTLNFITSSLIILLIFFISRSLFKVIFKETNLPAFFVALLFCIMYNINELYAWSIIFANNIAYILYLASFYFYLNADKKNHYTFLSIISYFIAIFIYEIGIFLPLIILIYDFAFHKNWKRSLLYIMPLGIYGIIRITHWFGFGWIFIDRDNIWCSSGFLQILWQNIGHNFVREIAINGLNIFHGIRGLVSLNIQILTFLVIVDFISLFLIFKYVIIRDLSTQWKTYNFKNAMKLSFIAIIGIIVSHIVISISGGSLQSRYLLFTDFFVLLIAVILIVQLMKKKIAIYPLFCLIFMLMLISQGVLVNWIIAGDICNSVNKSISENEENIASYNYIFFNGSDLINTLPNYDNYLYSIFGQKYIEFIWNDNDQYNFYLNSECLQYWVINSMVFGRVNNSTLHVIYGNLMDNNINVSLLENGSILYNNGTSDEIINRTEYYEFNSTNLFKYYYTKKNSDILYSPSNFDL